jgi:uncharacterized protein (TIGR02284 family)
MNINEIDKRVLNNIIQINNDRNLNYTRAIAELHSKDDDLKTIFAGMSRQSAHYAEALMREIESFEDNPPNEFITSGKISRTAIDNKVAFSGHDRQLVLNDCESREDTVKKAYEIALSTQGISLKIKSILESQQTELRAAHNHIKELRDSVA